MIILLHGTDSYRRAQRVSVLRNAFIKKFDPAGLNTRTFDGTGWTAADFAQLSGGGLFAEKRFVILTNPFALKAEHQETLARVLPRISDDIIFVVSTDALPAKKSDLKAALVAVSKTPGNKAEEFKALTPGEAESFAHAEAKKYGVAIEPAAVRFLASRLAHDTWQLGLLVKSLAFRLGGAPITHSEKSSSATNTPLITAALAQESLGDTPQENFFALTDALSAKDAKKTLEILNKHIADGALAPMIIAVIDKHILLLRLCLWAEVNNAPDTIPGVHPFVLKKAQQQARHYTESALATAHQALLQLDVDSKNGAAPDPLSSLTLILTDLTAPAA